MIKSENKIARVGGLQLIAAGAIGRWMAFSQDHAYMVTTVAAATKYQGMDFASKLLCEMILAHKSGHLGEDKNYNAYSVDRTRLMGVLSKVVDSILLNVVNAGHTLGDIPVELQSLCVHLVGPATFAGIVLKILRSNADVLLLCDRFQGDILLWVLAHFDGSVEVSVAGKQAFRRDSLRGKRHFIMMVKSICGEDCRKTCHTVELSELLGGTWTRTLNKRDDQTRKTSTGQRLPLYAIEPPDYSMQRDILNREEMHKVRVFAQRMVWWMMGVPLKNNPDFNCIGFETAFSSELADVQLRIGDLLYRWPGILHDVAGKGSATLAPLAFIPPEVKESEASDILYEPDLQPPSALCECFPALADLLGEIQNRCMCRICRNKGAIDDCKEGCLCDAALSRIFMLIGNAVADGFGVKDASGMIGLQDYIREVRQLLWKLAEGFVWWDVWFNIAACTTLGYSPKGVVGAEHMNNGGNALVAVQYGSNVVAAKWLDLTQKISADKCFALEMAEGQISGVQEQCVFLQSEIKMELSCDLSKATGRLPTDTHELWQQKIAEKDQSAVTLQHAIVGSRDPKSLRLITVVNAGSCQRIIDPADTLAGVVRSTFVNPAKRHCQHSRGGSSTGIADGDAKNWYLWSFDDLLTSWGIENQGTFFTNSLDTHLKVNVAISLSVKGCVVRDTQACLLCALETLETYHSTFGRRIINYQIKEQALVRR
jgi:hypothetical protein